VCPAEGGSGNALTERSQVDGVVIEELHARNMPTRIKKSATIRSNFGARSANAFATAVAAVPAVEGIPRTAARREPTIAALSELPA
jgi:hypothetical protein